MKLSTACTVFLFFLLGSTSAIDHSTRKCKTIVDCQEIICGTSKCNACTKTEFVTPGGVCCLIKNMQDLSTGHVECDSDKDCEVISSTHSSN